EDAALVGRVDDALQLPRVSNLDRAEEADAGPDVCDRGMVRERTEGVREHRLELLHALDESFALDHVEVGEPDRAGRRMARVREAVAGDVLCSPRPATS